MHTLRIRLLAATDRMVGALLATILVGTALAFGGATWWARPAVAALVLLLGGCWLLHAGLEGTWRLIKSPAPALGLLALLLALVQLAPLPPSLAGRISPRSRDWHSRGMTPELARADDPAAEVPEPMGGRSAATVDRPATLRWLAGGVAGLGLFLVVAHATDRLGRLRLVWGSVVAAFGLNTAIVLVQLVGASGGLFGSIEPGQGPAWAPSRDDLLASPGATTLRAPADPSSWTLPRPGRSFLTGSLMGGPGAYLALGALALPLGLALALQLVAPRGSRERLADRLKHSGQGGVLALLMAATVVGSTLVGLMAGPVLGVAYALGLIAAGLPAARGTGLRGAAWALTALALLALAGGIGLGELGMRPAGLAPLAARADWAASVRTWRETSRIARDFPVLGSGLGSFASIHPYYKGGDAGPTTALSSLLQWWAEAGAAGLALLAAAGAWALARLPRALRRVGSADRPLAYGLVGALGCFAMVSALHWTVQLTAVALSAIAVAATCDRWLAGGTDLFVEGP